jgi:hypothetical protein
MGKQEKGEDEAVVCEQIDQVEDSYRSGGGSARLVRARKVNSNLKKGLPFVDADVIGNVEGDERY